MTAPLKICAVSGSRADWGLLSTPLALLRDDPAFDLKLVVTGQHLVATAGNTAAVIEAEGFAIDARVDMDLTSDTARNITRSMGLAVSGFADVLAVLQPDLLMVLGDRYEILAAVEAALLARIPVAHLCGGDLTEGAMDDAIRHAITKMSHLHFATNAESARRLRQLGEDPECIHTVGSPGLDRIRRTPIMERAALFDALGLTPRDRTLVVTFHPVTLEDDSERQMGELLAALHDLGPDTGLIFTGSNADPGGQSMDRMISAFVAYHPNAVAHASLGATRYFSALTYADAAVGNSSSGLYEVPSFTIPTVNIGDRQGGRLRAASVIDCPPDRAAILAAIRRAYDTDCRNVVNPYGDGHAAERIVATLKTVREPRSLLKKRFYDQVAA